MTLTLEISPEIEAQIERAAAQQQTDVRAFIVAAAAEKAARSEEPSEVPNTAARRQLDALDELLSLGARLTAGTLPLADDAVARSYADYHDAKEAA